MKVLCYGIYDPPQVHALVSNVGNSEANTVKLVFNFSK
jgi:hypothetical protein